MILMCVQHPYDLFLGNQLHLHQLSDRLPIRAKIKVTFSDGIRSAILINVQVLKLVLIYIHIPNLHKNGWMI